MEYRGHEIIKDRNGEPIYTKTAGQDKLVAAIEANDIIFVNGPSGTGKTAIATWIGIDGIDRGQYDKLILTRPLVTSGEEVGFLPGSLDEKAAPYMEPLYNAIYTIKGKRKTAEDIVKEMPTAILSTQEKRARKENKKAMQEQMNATKDFYDKVQVCPLAFIRGSTLSKSYIVCDEFQNTTKMQMKMMITRLGRGSKMIICGDPNQCDLNSRIVSGFIHAQKLLAGIPRIGFVTLGVDDIVRHKLIKEIICRYEVPGYVPNSGKYPTGAEFYAKSSTDAQFAAVPAHTWERDREGYDFSDDDEDDAIPSNEVSSSDGLCRECGGTGDDDFGHVCRFCNGTGLEPLVTI